NLQKMIDVGFLGRTLAALVDMPARGRIGSLQNRDPIFHGVARELFGDHALNANGERRQKGIAPRVEELSQSLQIRLYTTLTQPYPARQPRYATPQFPRPIPHAGAAS